MIEEVMHFGFEFALIVCTGISSVVVWKFKRSIEEKERLAQERNDSVQEQQRKLDERLGLLEKALCAILRDRIMQSSKFFMEQGMATPACRANIIAMHEVYKALGGNGIVDEYFNQLINLPVSTEKDCV